MIVGKVDKRGNAIIPVQVRGAEGRIKTFQVVIDTGFSDWLTLSRADIESLSLRPREQGRYLLADGSETTTRLYTAEVEWFGRWRRIIVVELDGGPLLGMAMMRGYHLGIDVIDDGRIQIEPLSESKSSGSGV
jgi:clan AA aspartic protease